MSWLARSLANSLKFDDDAEGGKEEEEEVQHITSMDSPRGVKEDLSELTRTLTRQLWGVASFLAPPPVESSQPLALGSATVPPSKEEEAQAVNQTNSFISKQSIGLDDSDSPTKLSGFRNDFAEIGGKFRTGISKLSTNKAVTEISKIASSILPFVPVELEDVQLEGPAIGVTEEVLTFARNISMHPETWLDFPLFVDGDDTDEFTDFDMSDAQQGHAAAVEHLAPRLAALRIELCPRHMTEGCFWKIYFVLVHPRLSKSDAELLSTQQIVEARAMLLREQQKRIEGIEAGSSVVALEANPAELSRSSYTTIDSTVADGQRDKHAIEVSEIKFVDKSIVEEACSTQKTSKGELGVNVSTDNDEGDDWLDDGGDEEGAAAPIGNDEDVSFSDLEEEDDASDPTSARGATDASESSKGSREWVQLGKSSSPAGKDAHSDGSSVMKGSSDWLALDDIDVA